MKEKNNIISKNSKRELSSIKSKVLSKMKQYRKAKSQKESEIYGLQEKIILSFPKYFHRFPLFDIFPTIK